jgi:methylenetetrahydrofolate reductase (NADPH)
MHISEKLAEAEKAKRTTFSFEFFPPKTAQGIQNLYARKSLLHPQRRKVTSNGHLNM